MDVGLAPLVMYVLPMWAAAAFALYWVIRLGVRHGTLDAYRIDRTDQRIAAMDDDLRRGAAPVPPVDRT